MQATKQETAYLPDSAKKTTEKGLFECQKHGVEFEIMENDFLGKPLEFCPKCGNEQDEREKQQKIRAEQETINRKITNTMLSPRFKTKTFENYVVENSAQAAAVKDIKKFIDNFNTCVGLIFIGNSGTGKNHLASAVVKEIVLKHNKTALVTKAIKVIRAIKESWKREGEYESLVIKSFVRPDLLVIDELGIQYGSHTEKMYLTEIIDDRYEERKPTILSGNVTVDELEEIVGERVVERFRENGYDGDSVVVFDWESYRGKNKKERKLKVMKGTEKRREVKINER